MAPHDRSRSRPGTRCGRLASTAAAGPALRPPLGIGADRRWSESRLHGAPIDLTSPKSPRAIFPYCPLPAVPAQPLAPVWKTECPHRTSRVRDPRSRAGIRHIGHCAAVERRTMSTGAVAAHEVSALCPIRRFASRSGYPCRWIARGCHGHADTRGPVEPGMRRHLPAIASRPRRSFSWTALLLRASDRDPGFPRARACRDCVECLRQEVPDGKMAPP